MDTKYYDWIRKSFEDYLVQVSNRGRYKPVSIMLPKTKKRKKKIVKTKGR